MIIPIYYGKIKMFETTTLCHTLLCETTNQYIYVLIHAKHW